MLYQHSFWYRASQKVFEDALKADPECGIAYWGIALSLLWNPHVYAAREESCRRRRPRSRRARPSAPRPSGSAIISTRSASCMPTTRRSTTAPAFWPMRRRWSNWRSAIPNDDEAQIHYALALNTSASPADKTYANQLKGAAILEPIAERQPQHPGVSHYLIHLYDYPPIAEKGLNAARRYAKIAPAAAHAQHMPSHIFTRVGYWTESIASNTESARVAKDAGDFARTAARHGLPGLCLSAARPGRESQGSHRRDGWRSPVSPRPIMPGPYALAISPARYVVERGDWKAAADLQVRPSPLPHVQAITHFARALGAARSGNPEAAKADIAKLAELRDKLRDAKDAYWSEQVDIERQVATAWVLYAEASTMTR